MTALSNNGKPFTYFIRTFGCQMNMHDSEHIAGVLEDAGYLKTADLEKASLVVFNTCSVRKSAEDRVWGNLGRIPAKRNGLPVVVVCGCMAERHQVGIFLESPAVDLVLGLGSLDRLPELAARCVQSKICDLGDINSAMIDHLPYRRRSNLKAWVPVSHGCNNRCSYCVVPFVRGPERSRPLREITREIEGLAREGVLEVTLLGQNVNSYGRDLPTPCSFAQLLEEVAGIQGLRRIKFETSHPRDLDEAILEVMRDRHTVCEHLHLPVQSGSDRVLSSMNRGYGRREYMHKVTRARQLVPDLVITTDIIVGFPGETEDDFNDTMDLVGAVGFDAAYLFIYSHREGTPAADMPGEPPPNVKSARFEKLSALQNELTERSLAGMVGRAVEVLIEGPAKRGDYVAGRTRGHQVVLVPAERAPREGLVSVIVEATGKHSARGRIEEVLELPSESEACEEVDSNGRIHWQ